MSRYVSNLLRETRSRVRRPQGFGVPAKARSYQPIEDERTAEIPSTSPAFTPREAAKISQTEYKQFPKQIADVARRDFEKLVERESLRVETIVREVPVSVPSEPRAQAKPRLDPPLEILSPRETWEPLEIEVSNQFIAQIEPPSASQPQRRQREIVRVATPAPESIEISIGKIEVIIDAEPKPAMQIKPSRAHPAPPKNLTSNARLARQYLDR